jgi:hypothetical protein
MATSNGSMSTRIKSSFIYLANAVSDLRGNWATLALVLSPLVLLSALCVLPDALNLQHELVRKFEPGVRTIGYFQVQTPYAPDIGAPQPPLFGRWVLVALHLAFAAITFVVKLVSLCAIKRIRSGERKARLLNETIEIYREAISLAPAFLWISLLQVIAIVVGIVLLVVPGLLAMVWLYFSSYALVFENKRSWPALFHSRELMRGRTIKVAVRIIVFLALWSGYNWWVGGAFLGLSLLIGPIAIWSGALCVTIFLFSLIGSAIAYTTIAFFIAAGVRLYQDLQAIASENAVAIQEASMPATAPLTTFTAPAAE